MSWNFRKAGKDKEALKVAVQKEFAPQAVKDEVCARIDGIPVGETQIIFVGSYGHLEEDPSRQFRGLDDMCIRVWQVDYVG